MKIAIVAGLSTIIGLTAAVCCGWPWFCSIPVALTVFLSCYKPQEVVSAISTAMRSAYDNGNTIVWKTLKFVCIAAYAVLWIVSCVTIPFVVRVFFGTYYEPSFDGLLLMVSLLFGCMLAAMGMLIIHAKQNDPANAFPLMRHLSKKIYWERYTLVAGDEPPEWWKWSATERLLFTTIYLPLYQLVGMAAMLVLVTDFILTIFMRLASKDRVAGLLGTTIGCIAGGMSIFFFGDTTPPIVSIVTGGMAGMIAGPTLHEAALLLTASVAEPAATAS